MKFKNGDVFEGEFKNNKANGHGIIKYNSGDIFEGEFKNGKKNGYGKTKLKKGEEVEANYKDGELNGQFKFKLKDGKIFETEYKNGKKIDSKDKICDPNSAIVLEISLDQILQRIKKIEFIKDEIIV